MAIQDEKRCSKCSIVKPRAAFRVRNAGKYLSSHCRECICAYEHAARKSDPNRKEKDRLRSARRWADPAYRSKKLAYHKRQWKDPAFAARKGAYIRAWQHARLRDPITRPKELARIKASIQRLRAIPEWVEKWRLWHKSENGIALRRVLNHRRRARMAGAASDGDKAHRALIVARGECIYCGSTDRITLDHFYPISKGGQDVIGNLVPACKRCNSSKHDAQPIEWVVRTGGVALLRGVVEFMKLTESA